MNENKQKPELIRVNDELAVSPRLYRIMKLIARTSWGDDFDWYLHDMRRMILNDGKNLLHEYTYCVRHGITRAEYSKQNPITMWELL